MEPLLGLDPPQPRGHHSPGAPALSPSHLPSSVPGRGSGPFSSSRDGPGSNRPLCPGTSPSPAGAMCWALRSGAFAARPLGSLGHAQCGSVPLPQSCLSSWTHSRSSHLLWQTAFQKQVAVASGWLATALLAPARRRHHNKHQPCSVRRCVHCHPGQADAQWRSHRGQSCGSRLAAHGAANGGGQWGAWGGTGGHGKLHVVRATCSQALKQSSGGHVPVTGVSGAFVHSCIWPEQRTPLHNAEEPF